MDLTQFIHQIVNKYIELASSFFQYYNLIGRKILDVFHVIFENIFNALLFIAVLMSFFYFIMSIYAIIKKQKKKENDVRKYQLPFVTVQIPTFNELAAIRCAKNCLDFDYPKDKYEIIIGDDSNDREISRKLKEFAKEHDIVKIIKRPTNAGYKPGNLNNMLKYSKGEVIVIFDSDFMPQENFLTRVVQPFMKDKNIAGVQARWTLVNANQNMITVLGTTIVSIFHHVTIPFMHRSQKIAFLCGSAEAVRKDVLLKLGGWENGNFTEDIEFSLRLIKNGYAIEYLDDLECNSEVPYTIKDLYRQQMRWAYGVISSWKKHFREMNKTKHLNLLGKFYVQGILCSGYLLSLLLAGLFITGTLSFITHAPEPIKWGEFTFKLFRNIFLTSGLLFASYIALMKANKARLTLPMIASSFSYGLVVTYHVNVGIFKALAKTPMEWYMLNKQGNKLVE